MRRQHHLLVGASGEEAAQVAGSRDLEDGNLIEPGLMHAVEQELLRPAMSLAAGRSRAESG